MVWSKTRPGWTFPSRMSGISSSVGACGCGAAGEGDVAHDRVETHGYLRVLGDAQPADDAAVADYRERGGQRLFGANTLDDGMGAVTSGQFADLVHAFVAPLGNDVGGAEVAAQVGAVGVAAHQDDPIGAESLGGQDRAESHCAVSYDGH